MLITAPAVPEIACASETSQHLPPIPAQVPENSARPTCSFVPLDVPDPDPDPDPPSLLAFTLHTAIPVAIPASTSTPTATATQRLTWLPPFAAASGYAFSVPYPLAAAGAFEYPPTS